MWKYHHMQESLQVGWGLPVKGRRPQPGNKVLENLMDNTKAPLLDNSTNIFKSNEAALLWILNHEKELVDAGYKGKGLYIRFRGNKQGVGAYSKGSYDIIRRHNTKIWLGDDLEEKENGSYYRYVPI